MNREELLFRQAVELYGAGKFEAAERCLREAITLSDQPELNNNLGIVLKAQSRIPEAIDAYRHAIELNPEFADARYNLGNAYRACDRISEAIECFEGVVKTAPRHAHATAALGQSLLASGRVEEALTILQKAAELNASDAGLYCDLGNALVEVGKIDEAVTHYRRALRLDPKCARAWYCAGNAESSRKEWAIASVCFQKCLEIAPDWHEANHNLGQALFELGDTDGALERFRKAEAGTQPGLPRAMIAVVIPGAPAADNQSILEARRNFAGLLPEAEKFSHRPVIRERLKIGYVSSFFHRDNWMKPVWNLINRHDRAKFEIQFFSSAPALEIPHGYRARTEDRFHEIGELTNRDAGRLISACEIDLLVDLNGYSDLRRLPLFALRPAPRIAGWFNLYATTGIPAYDVLIGDSEVIPAAEEPFYTERILRVRGSYLSFDVNYPVPEVQSPPCAVTGKLTFGCLAPQYKINSIAIAAWGRVLSQVPDSQLLLKSRALASSSNRQFVLSRFEQQGIDRERILLEGPAEHFDFLKTYDRIDIALDTFPYNGGTTTTEAIWQGVPVVSYPGDRWVSRTSASILRAGNLSAWIAKDVEGYVDMAIRAATRPNAIEMLADLRRNMRSRLRASPVCDSDSFARNMEEIYTRICEEASYGS